MGNARYFDEHNAENYALCSKLSSYYARIMLQIMLYAPNYALYLYINTIKNYQKLSKKSTTYHAYFRCALP